MVEEAVKTYRVAYERDESGWWVASVRGIRGCHTQGRTVDEARRRIVEAMDLFVDDARTARFVDDVKLPAEAAQAVRAYTTLRKKAEQEDRVLVLDERHQVHVVLALDDEDALTGVAFGFGCSRMSSRSPGLLPICLST